MMAYLEAAAAAAAAAAELDGKEFIWFLLGPKAARNGTAKFQVVKESINDQAW
jgi:hypothetical protein